MTSGRSASKPYMKMVDNSYLGSSDEVTKLIERVEATFIKHFANGNRSKGMNILRPKPRRERHRTTFSLGFLVDGTAALVLALVLVIRTRKNLENEIGHNSDDRYMSTMFPLYSLFGYVITHDYVCYYAANIYFWRRYRVNYSFIFGFKEVNSQVRDGKTRGPEKGSIRGSVVDEEIVAREHEERKEQEARNEEKYIKIYAMMIQMQQNNGGRAEGSGGLV